MQSGFPRRRSRRAASINDAHGDLRGASCERSTGRPVIGARAASTAGAADEPGGAPCVPFFDERLRNHQTTAPMRTAPARMPKAIQPHCVLSAVVSLFFDAAAAPAAAAAAGLTPVVVAAVTVAE